jgi:hypothetical protein
MQDIFLLFIHKSLNLGYNPFSFFGSVKQNFFHSSTFSGCGFRLVPNAPQYGVGGDFGTRFCPPLKMPERGLVAGCGTYNPAAPILLVVKSCYKYCLSFFSIISVFQLFFIKYNPPLFLSVGCVVCVFIILQISPLFTSWSRSI